MLTTRLMRRGFGSTASIKLVNSFRSVSVKRFALLAGQNFGRVQDELLAAFVVVGLYGFFPFIQLYIFKQFLGASFDLLAFPLDGQPGFSIS